jgi:hypothetical protein
MAQGADDAVRAAANAVTFGMADRFAGAMPGGGGTDAQVKLSQEARARSPIASIGGDIAGTVAIPSRIAPALAARWGGGLGARAAGYGIEGGLIGAGQGAGNTYTGNVEDYAKNALMGGAFGLGTGAVVGGAFGPRAPVSSAQRPTDVELRRFTDLAYDRLRANPTRYDPASFSTAADDVATRLRALGHVPDYRPTTWNAIDQMRQLQDVTPASIDVIRQGLNRIPRTEAAAADRASAREVKRALDDFVAAPPTGAVLPGQNQQVAAAAAELGQIARDSRSGQGRAQTMANIRQYAEDLAASQHSGRNVDNIIRQQVRSRLLSPHSPAAQQRVSGFNAPEREALREIIHAGPVTNTIRMLGNMGGGGGGIATPLLGLGAGGVYGGYTNDLSAGALLGAGLAGGGMGLRSVANRLGRNRIEAAENLIRERNPLYQNRVANAPMVPGPSALSGLRIGDQTGSVRDAITLEWLRQQGIPRITVTPDPERRP